MRILGFSHNWLNYLTGKAKLSEPTFTTFRFTRKDKDWAVGEIVRVVFKPRSKGGGGLMGNAKILNKERRDLFNVGISLEEVYRDGFATIYEMGQWLDKTYKKRWTEEPMNKLTLRWL